MKLNTCSLLQCRSTKIILIPMPWSMPIHPSKSLTQRHFIYTRVPIIGIINCDIHFVMIQCSGFFTLTFHHFWKRHVRCTSNGRERLISIQKYYNVNLEMTKPFATYHINPMLLNNTYFINKIHFRILRCILRIF